MRKRVIEQNVIDASVGTAIVQNQSGPLHYFENESPDGSWLQGYDKQILQKVDELAARLKDSLLISF